jgi:hypothetical protein
MNRRTKLYLTGLAVIFLLLFCLNQADAKETEFEFYYQNIEKVVQINNPEPEGWWEKTKKLVKGAYNTVLKTWEQTVGRKYLTGEGTKRWYSKENSNIAYDVRRVKVKSEEHLISLMGASSEDELNNGQKAMLAVYRHSKSQAIKDRMKYGYLSKIKVIMSDTSGYEDSKKYPEVRRDFWPYSNGSLIQMSSGRYNYSGSDADARSTFVHEYSHSMDRTIKEFIKPYGKDGSHYSNEMTRPRTAFVEGWAEFNEMLDSEDEVAAMQRSIKKVRIEDKSESGKYTDLSADDERLSGTDLLSVEGINAMILYRLATEVPGGRDKIFTTFSKTNWKVFRSLKTFAKDFAKRYPEDAATLAAIIDSESKGRLSDSELKNYVGENADSYISQRGASEDSPEAQAGSVATGIVVDTDKPTNPFAGLSGAAAKITSQDFSTELEKTFEALGNAQRSYLKAVEEGNAEAAGKLQQKLQERKQRFEQLKKLRIKKR